MSRLAAAAAVAALVAALAAGCGGGGSERVAKVGAQTITKAQLEAVLAIGRKQYTAREIPFPKRGSAEYRLLTQQALAYLTQKAQAAQADRELGVEPAPLLVTPASFARVTASVRPSSGESELRRHRQRTAMQRWLAGVRQRFPITYSRGYEPVRTSPLAREVWRVRKGKKCDLPVGSYSWKVASTHGCVEVAPVPGVDGPPCGLIDLPTGAPNGFTSAEEDSGYAGYVEDVAGSCVPDPRNGSFPVTEEVVAAREQPIPVSDRRASGTTRLTDGDTRLSLEYPRRFHARRWGGTMLRAPGMEFANFPLAGAQPTRPLARTAVDLTLYEGTVGVYSRGGPRDSSFPLSLSHFRRSGGSRYLEFQAAGGSFFMELRTGSAPSATDMAAIAALVASIAFPPLHAGTFTPSHEYVLGRASSFPLGFVRRYPGVDRGGRRMPFFLVHSLDGFLELSALPIYSNGHACTIRFDPKARLFRCANGAEWSLDGRMIVDPDPARFANQSMQRQPVTVSYDGYLLVS